MMQDAKDRPLREQEKLDRRQMLLDAIELAAEAYRAALRTLREFDARGRGTDAA